MKYLMISTLALSALIAAPASAASFDDLTAAVDIDAFSAADADWQRRMANRTGECGSYGKNDRTRVAVLVANYNAVAGAVSAGDEAGAMSAARELADRIDSSTRFEKCWNAIARDVGVPRSFARMISKI